MNSEIGIQQVSANLGLPKQLVKLPYLVSMTPDPTSKSKKIVLFLAWEKPNYFASHFEVKGMFYEGKEDDIMGNMESILTNQKTDLTCEMQFPMHRLIQSKNLGYKAKIK